LPVKDIIATKTMPTTCGSPIYRDHVVGKDAACVTQLVKAGAIVLGKSVTTEFAGGHAGKTHNPHNLRHTPGRLLLGLGGGGRRFHGARRATARRPRAR
jgi:Asp-tRNA(Asn)/Glu-tRNA(Gln) amidotransferase A subunit family amidase